MADLKKDQAATGVVAIESVLPAETDLAAELAKARAHIAALEEKVRAASPGVMFTSAKEIDAGVDDAGVQWWWVKIDLPPVGGVDLKINGMPLYHGEQYKVTSESLRTIKEMMFRCWQHEANISGSNENFYRRQTNQRIG